MDCAWARQDRRRAQVHARRGRSGRQEREAYRHARPHRSGARVAGRHAARAEAARARTKGIRSLARARAEPAARLLRRCSGSGRRRRPPEGARLLREARRTHQERRYRASRVDARKSVSRSAMTEANVRRGIEKPPVMLRSAAGWVFLVMLAALTLPPAAADSCEDDAPAIGSDRDYSSGKLA